MKNVFLVLLLLSSFSVFSQKKSGKKSNAAAVPVTEVEGIKEYKYANGLQVLLAPDVSQSNVIVNVVYGVGSRHEGYGETGMAHLLEHMMFKGSKKFRNIKQKIADKGADANGTTWYDRTDYYEILPASDSNLSWSLEMEADRMVNSLMRDEDLQKEFTVVRNEFEMGENYPNRVLIDRMVSTMYLWHNYGKSTIGSKEDIEKVPITNLKNFYEKYYQPDNATLIIGGKFDETQALALVTKYFSKIPRPARKLQPSYTVEPAQDGQRFVELRRNGDLQYAGLSYHTPAFADTDYAANSALVHILTNDPSGIFYKGMVETKMATKVYGANYVLHDPGFTYFMCDVPAGNNIDSVKNVFITIADHLSPSMISQEDLDRAKNALLKYYSNTQNNTINYCIAQAEYIGAGDWRLFYITRDRIEKLTLEDVRAALEKYYMPSNRTVGVFIPDKNPKRVSISPAGDITAFVNAYKGKETTGSSETFEATIPNIKKRTEYGTLSNGMRYALLKKPVKGDKIYVSMVLKTGDENSLSGKHIIPMLTARMLKNGTTSRTKNQINDQLDKLKTTIEIGGNAGTINVSMDSDKEHVGAGLDILGDILLHPSFNQNEYDKMILDVKSELENNRTDPQYVAFNTISKKTELYPKGHPLYPMSIDEELAMLKQTSLDDLKNFYKEFYGANHGFAAFVGNIDTDMIKSFLDKNLTQFNTSKPFKEVEEKYFDVKGTTETIEIKDKTNAISIGVVNVPLKQGDPEFVALDLANEMLGGGTFISSRIASRLRESEGMSYGAGSVLRFNYQFAASSWLVYAIFNPIYKVKLDSALHDEITKAIQTGFRQDELKSSLSAWLQQRKAELGNDEALASRLAGYMSVGKDLDFFTTYEDAASKLTLDQVNAALKKYLSPDKIILVYAGDFTKK